MICRGFIARHVQGVFLVVLLNSCQELLFCYSVVLVRHTQVPEYVLISNLGYERATWQLCTVVVRPYRYYLELLRITIEVHFEVMIRVSTQSSQLAALLERHTLYESANLIVVRIERQVLVFEIIDGKRLAVLVFYLLVPHFADSARATRIDVSKGSLLVMMDDTVLLHVHINILHAARQHQAGVVILLGVYVA